MNNQNKVIGVVFILLLVVMGKGGYAGFLTPLTSEIYVQVEIAALEYQVAEMQNRLDSQSDQNTHGIPDTSSSDAIYKKFNTNFMEHLRYGDAHKIEINRWLEQNPQQKITLEQLRHQANRLSSQLESSESN